MIKLIVFDIDGTLTNGQIIYNNINQESKAFNAKDGLAIRSMQKLGKKIAFITGRNSKIVSDRAKELKIDFVFQGIVNKLKVLQEIIAQEGFKKDEIAVIGDDMNDYQMLNFAGLSACPSDANEFIKPIVDLVCKAKGGQGAGAELIYYILKQEGLEQQFINLWQDL